MAIRIKFRLRGLFFLTWILWLAPAAPSWAILVQSHDGETQTIFVPRQSVVFNKDGSVVGAPFGHGFAAYCLEYYKAEPEKYSQPMTAILGTVTFTLANGMKYPPMPVNEALSKGLIEIYPYKTTTGFVTLVRGKDQYAILKAEFEPTVFVTKGSDRITGELISGFLPTVDPSLEGQTEQDKIWNEGTQLFAKSSTNGIITYTKVNRVPSSQSKIRFLSNPQGGTAILINDSYNNLIAIDTGFGRDAGAALANQLCEESDKLKGGKLLILATHPHEDHIAGLKALFDGASCTPEMIVAPSTAQTNLAARFDLWKSLMTNAEIRSQFGFSKDSEVLNFALKKTNQVLLSLIHSSKIIATANPAIAGISMGSDDPKSAGSSLCTYRFLDATTINEHSLVTRYRHNEVTTTQMGDANLRVIRALLKAFPEKSSEEEFDPNTSLRSQILVWPHHFWCPTNSDDQEALLQFLQKVHPQIIIVTQPGDASQSSQRLSKLRLKALFDRYCSGNPGVVIHWLEEGQVNVITLRKPPDFNSVNNT